jgi:hypothetical protein
MVNKFISTKQSPLISTHWTQIKHPGHMMLEIQVLTLDKRKSVTELNLLMWSQVLFGRLFIRTVN